MRVLLFALAFLLATVGICGGEAIEPAAGLDTLKSLAGTWEGTNEKGQEVRLTYEIVALGSAVLETIEIQEKKKIDMVTLYHLDGDNLMLTHYCAVGNQPRMKAVAVEKDRIKFDFMDVTGLSSPDAGHMRRAEFEFHDEDRLTSRWTWHQDGEDVFTVVVNARRR